MEAPFITAPAVEGYLAGLLPPRPEVLAALERVAAERDIPIVGPVVARTLHLLALAIGARRVFELGSAIGYSTLWWAAAVGDGGEVFYTDRSRENAAAAAESFRRAGMEARIRILCGDALAAFAATPGGFDIVFIDLDKEQYPAALRAAAPRVRAGGLLIADNVLWRGQVAGPESPRDDEAARVMRAFNRELYASTSLYPVVLPLRDGLAVARKQG